MDRHQFLNLIWPPYKPPLPDPIAHFSRIAETAATPDELIAAKIAHSFATNFDDWELKEYQGSCSFKSVFDVDLKEIIDYIGDNPKRDWIPDTQYVRIRDDLATRLINTDITIRWPLMARARDGDGSSPWLHTIGPICLVENIPISTKANFFIIETYKRLKQSTQAARDAAAKARREMELNEQKWNLAERLLQMKRNEFGALVPIKTLED